MSVFRTYRLTAPIAAAMNRVCRRHRIQQSELVRFLLADALGRVERGELTIPTKPAKYTVDWNAGGLSPRDWGESDLYE